MGSLDEYIFLCGIGGNAKPSQSSKVDLRVVDSIGLTAGDDGIGPTDELSRSCGGANGYTNSLGNLTVTALILEMLGK